MKVAEKPEKSGEKAKSRKRALVKLVKNDVSDEDRDNMNREAAYLRAEQRDFESGDAVQDWLDAEWTLIINLIIRGLNNGNENFKRNF